MISRPIHGFLASLALAALCSGCSSPNDGAAETASGAPAVNVGAATAPAAESSFGDVAFQTFESKGFRIVFLNDRKVRKTWANMGGAAVDGEFTQTGKQIAATWDPQATHHGSTSERFVQTGPCALARYERVDRDGVLHDDQPQIYQRSEPRCDAVRIVQ